jgi:adenylyl-sulfate kinase
MGKEHKGKNITWHASRVSVTTREQVLGQRGYVVWLTGFSGSGKSTIACLLEERLIREGHPAYVLDGDNVRHGLNRDLGFSAQDRDENIRRVGEVAAMFSKAGVVAIAAFISPYAKGRQEAREAAGGDAFVEIFLDTPIAECEYRDPKGLYKKARAGQLSDFTGIDAPYERPENADITLHTEKFTPPECVEQIMQFLSSRQLLAGKQP